MSENFGIPKSTTLSFKMWLEQLFSIEICCDSVTADPAMTYNYTYTVWTSVARPGKPM